MPIVADASVAIRGDMSGFHRDLKGAETATQGFVGRLKSMFSPRNLAFGAGLFGVGLGVRNLVDFAGDAAAAFGELEQTSRTIDSVFGRSADTIREWGETAAETAGMSQQTFMSSAAIMGQTLQNMGFTIQDSADKTVLLLQRAADLAIAFGKRPADALLAITAAMRGERDTIEKFGVAIKQVDVNAEIAALGLDTSTAAAKKNAEAIAVVNLVLDQSADSAGRFADGQDDIAVKMAKTAARWDDFVTMGVGGQVAKFQEDMFEIADSFASDFERMGSGIDKFATHFGEQSQIIQRLAKENGISWDEMHEKIMTAMDVSGMEFPEVAATFSIEGQTLSDLTEEQYQEGAKAAGAGVKAMADATADAARAGGGVIAAEFGKIAGMFPAEIQAQVDEMKAAGEDIMGPDGLAGGILAAQQKPIDAIEELNRVMEESMSEAEQIAFLTGEDTLKSLQAGLSSPLLVDRLSAHEAIVKITDQLNTLGPAGAAAAAALLNALNLGIQAPDPLAVLRQSALRLAGIMTAPLMRSEPKDPLSPMRGMTHWGRDYIGILSNDITANLGTASAASRALAGALVPSMGGVGGAGSLDASVGGLGGTIVNVDVQGLVYGRDAAEIGSAVKRYAESGKLVRSKRIVNR